ncbi:MAG: HAMP domain-containing protein [Gammaproteobacteria bacterium]
MVEIYGPNNGFNWKLNEIVGAQVISVPMEVPMRRANEIFNTFMLSLFGVFLVVFGALNAIIHRVVTRRIRQLAHVADAISMGKPDAGELDLQGDDEIGALGRSFEHMRTSLASARNT